MYLTSLDTSYTHFSGTHRFDTDASIQMGDEIAGICWTHLEVCRKPARDPINLLNDRIVQGVVEKLSRNHFWHVGTRLR